MRRGICATALCRSLLMGVFYGFTFALILIDAFPVNPYRIIIKRKRADTDADPSSEQQKLIVEFLNFLFKNRNALF